MLIFYVTLSTDFLNIIYRYIHNFVRLHVFELRHSWLQLYKQYLYTTQVQYVSVESFFYPQEFLVQ